MNELSKEIGTAMVIMINMCYVPCGLHTLCHMMKIDAKGKPTPDTPWSTMRGRKPIASLEDVQAIAEDLEAQSGCGWSYGDIASKLVEIKSKKMNDEGYVQLTTPTVDKKTVRNYTALIAHQTNMSILQSSIMKTIMGNNGDVIQGCAVGVRRIVAQGA